MRLALIFVALALMFAAPSASAARDRDPLTPLEIDQLREAAQEPEKRIKLLTDFARARLLAIEQMRADPKLHENRGRQIQAHQQALCPTGAERIGAPPGR